MSLRMSTALAILTLLVTSANEPLVFDNALSAADDRYYELKRAHHYEFFVAGGGTLKLRLSGSIPLKATALFLKEKIPLEAAAGEAAEATLTVPAGKAQLVRLTLGSDGAFGDYRLELTPAPERVQRQPKPKAELLDKAARAERDQSALAAQREVGGALAEVAKRREEREELRRSKCQSSTGIYDHEAENGREVWWFCDTTTVTRTGEAWKVNITQTSADFQQFTAVERANVDTARHNAQVLKSPEATRQISAAERALAARIKLFLSTKRLPEAAYVKAAKAYKGP